MATVSDVAREVLASFNSNAGFLLAVQWVNSRYQEAATRSRFRHLRKFSSVTTVAAQTDYDTTVDVRWYGTFVYLTATAGTYRNLDETTIEELDTLYPGLPTLVGGPRVWADMGMNTAGTFRKVRFYPAPTATAGETLTYSYWINPVALTLTDNIPPMIPVSKLREGVLIDVARFEQAQATRSAKVDVAAVWDKMAMEQEMRWERAIFDMMRTDRVTSGDDDAIMLQQIRSGLQGPGVEAVRFPRS
jgi:hypothetical protein